MTFSYARITFLEYKYSTSLQILFAMFKIWNTTIYDMNYYYFSKTLYQYYKCNELALINHTYENFDIQTNNGKLDGKLFKRSCIYISFYNRVYQRYFCLYCWVFFLIYLICNDIKCLCINAFDAKHYQKDATNIK